MRFQGTEINVYEYLTDTETNIKYRRIANIAGELIRWETESYVTEGKWIEIDKEEEVKELDAAYKIYDVGLLHRFS